MKLNTLRPRRLRRTEAIRSMVRENTLSPADFVYPIFVVPGTNVKEEIPSMPNCYHLSVDNAVKVAEEVYKLGIPAVEVFGLPEYKDEIGIWSSSAMSASASTPATDTAGSSAAMKSTMTRRCPSLPKWLCLRRNAARISWRLPT